MELDPAWRERNFGIYQGLSDDRYERQVHDVDSKGGVLWSPENGESWRSVESRVLSAFEDIERRSSSGVTPIVVSHYGPIFCLLASVTGRRLEHEFRAEDYDEGGVSKIAFRDGERRLVFRNESAIEP
jgi:broad specificity phosphatase PhoE